MATPTNTSSAIDSLLIHLRNVDADRVAGAFSRFAPSRRPSEASTTSARSATTQPNIIDASQQDDFQTFHAAQWLAQQQQQQQPPQQPSSSRQQHQQQNSQLRQIAPAPRPNSPEEYVLANGLPDQPSREFTVEQPVHNNMVPHYGFPQQPAHVMHQQQQQQQQAPMARQPLPSEFVPVNSQHRLGTPMMDRNDSPAPDSGLDIGIMQGRQRSNTNNDQEMRELFNRNSHRSLQDVAKELHGNERGPSSERSRQLFAMLWIKSACRKGKTSVTRSRVYAAYVTRCAHEKIVVLNPASFGKLVRVLYPNLRTRRLGVRGESKYHYVEFELDIDAELDVVESPSQLPSAGPSGLSFADSLNLSNATRPSTAAGVDDAAPSPTENANVAEVGDEVPANNVRRQTQHAIYNQPQVTSIAELATTGSKTAKILDIQAEEPSTPTRLVLPPIDPYLPQGTDRDAAKSLEALYLSHCTSLIECIRFCKEKTFFHLFTAFHGTLTVPVQKLLTNPALEPWIEQCDLRMYQNMMQIVSVVALQVIPPHGLHTLRNISDRLVSHIRTSFEGQPEHVFRAKEAPAALFADLLDRTLRVNTTAHATANFLNHQANRTQMYVDFITFVRPRKIAQSVPVQGMEDVVNVLVSEIRQLLGPKDVPWDVEGCTVQGDHYLQNRGPSEVDDQTPEDLSNTLDRWVVLLRSLPARIPYASCADIIQYIQTIGTTITRDLTISSAESFGSWWCLKCWIDEMIWFLAEKGGFMRLTSTRAVSRGSLKRKMHQESEDVESRKHMRLSTGSAASDEQQHMVTLMGNHQSQVLAPLTPSVQNESKNAVLEMHNPGYDDSGISLPMSGEDSPMSKFTTTQVDNQRTEEGNRNGIPGLR